MDNQPPIILGINPELKELESKGRATYFSYFHNLPKIKENLLLKILNGKSHALVDKHLYVAYGSFNYKLLMEDWIETDEGKEYKPLLKKICSNE